MLTVSGIVRDAIEKTDLDFTDFISFSTIERSWLSKRIQLNKWTTTNSSSQIFIKLEPGTAQTKIEAQFSKIESHYLKKYPDWHYAPMLQPLSDLHFSSIGIFDYSRTVAEKSTLHILVAVAIIMLVIAAINFINLETAQASRRAKEVGVRKVMGSSRIKLVSQFLLESFILTCIAVIVSIVLAWLAFGYFTDFIPSGLLFNPTNSTIILFLLGCTVLVTLMAGWYPAFVLSSYRPALALKNLSSFSSGASRSASIRKGLIIFQFSCAQILIIATIVVGAQLRYMLNKDLGFTSEAIVYFHKPGSEKVEKNFLLKHELEQIPEIEVLSLHLEPPISDGFASSVMEFDTGKEKMSLKIELKPGDNAYLALYNIKLLAGRNVLPSDSVTEYLINETFMHQVGIQDPREALGKTVDRKTVVGVVKDFHTTPLTKAIGPIVIYNEKANFGCIGFKVNTKHKTVEDLGELMKKVEAAWKKIYPDEKFKYSFMDDTIKRFYEREQRTGKLSRTATGITILISCLGLFGLSSFTVIQRTKEIGIRKVLGATVNNITMLLSWDFLKLIVIAFLVSATPAYYIAEWWLKDFAYRTEITIWIFLMAGLASLLAAFLTVSIKTINAAKSDPVMSLRYE